MPKFETRRYLGDGVYVDHDGWQVRLTTETAAARATNTIYLEKTALDALHRYAIKFGLVVPDQPREREG